MNESFHQRAKLLAAQPYTTIVLVDDSEPEELLYVALNPELDGCMAQGETAEETESILSEFRVDYIGHLLKHNLPVPPP